MKGRTVLVASLLFLLIAGLTFASGGKEATGSSTSPSGTVIWWSPNWDSPAVRGGPGDADLVKKFQEKNPNIKVEIQQTVGQGLENKILVAIQSGSGFDVADVSQSWNISFAKTGGLLALDPYIKESKLDVSDFYAGNWATSQYDGKTWGMPYRAGSDGLFYNKKLFREAGLDPEKPPVTWDEVVTYGQKLTKKAGDKKQFGWGLVGGGETNNFMAYFSTTIWGHGGEYISSDFKTVTINQPPAVAGATFWATSSRSTRSPRTPLSRTTGRRSCRSLRRTWSRCTSRGPTHRACAQGEPQPGAGLWRLAEVKGRDPATNLGGWSLIVPKATKNAAATWKFVSFIAEPENMAVLTHVFPARKSAMKAARFQNPTPRPSSRTCSTRIRTRSRDRAGRT